MADVSISALRAALSTVDYPAAKDDLVRTAEQADAPVDVQKALRTLPPVDYGNTEEVIRSVHPDVGTGQTDRARVNPANRPPQPGVADRLR